MTKIINKQEWIEKQTELLNNSIFNSLEKDLNKLSKDYKNLHKEIVFKLSELISVYIDEKGNILNENLFINKLEELKQYTGIKLTELVYIHDADINNILNNYYDEVIKTQIENLEEIQFKQSSLNAIQFIQLYPYEQYSFQKNLYNMVFYTDKKLKEILTISYIKGKGINKVTREIKKTFNTVDYIARRIARTELSRVYNNANKILYKSENTKKVKWLDATERTRGSKVCKHCEKIATTNKGIYLIDEVPTIPQHPNCRCTLAPYVEI